MRQGTTLRAAGLPRPPRPRSLPLAPPTTVAIPAVLPADFLAPEPLFGNRRLWGIAQAEDWKGNF